MDADSSLSVWMMLFLFSFVVMVVVACSKFFTITPSRKNLALLKSIAVANGNKSIPCQYRARFSSVVYIMLASVFSLMISFCFFAETSVYHKLTYEFGGRAIGVIVGIAIVVLVVLCFFLTLTFTAMASEKICLFIKKRYFFGRHNVLLVDAEEEISSK